VSTAARQIATFHLCCARGDDPGAKAPGSALAATLLEPLAAALDANTNLIIVPYGVGHWLPFHALPWRLGPLVASHAVSYLPSASAVQYLDREPRPAAATDRILAVGNPSNMAYQPSPWSEPVRQQPLPAAELEAAYVASLFPEGEALLGPAATAEAVLDRLEKARVVHFATHGFLSNESPWLSSILLADGGALRLDDLVGLRLRADLVVLSACQTGRGEFNGGDDVLGFARGLLAAGARSAVVSLWPVDDDATSLLMAHFYRLLRQGVGPPAALQGAQNHLRTLGPEAMAGELARLKEALEETGHPALANDVGRLRHAVPKATTSREFARESPFYWAPFLLVGGGVTDE
jgi:CHAT domain-containing protein